VGVTGHLTSKPEFAKYYVEVLKLDAQVVSWVRFGYEVQLSSWPPENNNLLNKKLALAEPEFVLNNLRRLEKLVVLNWVEEKPRLVNNKRLVFNAKVLNPYIRLEKVPLERLDDVAKLLRPGSFGGTSDLDSKYYQVSKKPGFQP
jgi:hypothetical protein